MLLCTACITKSVKKPKSKPTTTTPAYSKIDVRTFDRPKVEMNFFDIGGIRLLNLLAFSENRGEYYSYQICNDSATVDNCKNGTISWGNRMLFLEPGTHKLKIRACVAHFRAYKGDNCGREEVYYYKQVSAANSMLAQKITEISNISQEIKSYAAKILEDLELYRAAKLNLDLEDRFDELAANQISLGEPAIAQMLNSPEYYLFYPKFSKKASPQNIATAEEKSLEDIADLEQKISDLSQELASLDGEQKDLSKDVSNNHTSALIMALGSSAIISGIITLSAGISIKLGFEKSAIDVVNSPFDIASNILKHVSGRNIPRTLEDIDASLSKETHKGSKAEFSYDVYTNKETKKIEYIVTKDQVDPTKAVIFDKPGILKLEFPNNNFKELNKITFEKNPDIQFAYNWNEATQKAKLKPDLESRFLVVHGQLYHLKFTSYKKTFPNLSPGTLDRINNHWIKLSQKGAYYKYFLKSINADPSTFNMENDFMKGVPLLSDSKELMEPPDAWKVPGKNWFDASNKKVSAEGLNFEYDIDKEAPKNIKTIKNIDALNHWIPGAAYTKNLLNTGLWQAEINLKTSQLDAIRNTAKTKIMINQYSKKTMYTGASLIAAGMASIIGVMVHEGFQLTEQNRPKQRLLNAFEQYALELKKLHEKRLIILQEVNKLSGGKKANSNLWIYSF